MSLGKKHLAPGNSGVRCRHLSTTPFLTFVNPSKSAIKLDGILGNSKLFFKNWWSNDHVNTYTEIWSQIDRLTCSTLISNQYYRPNSQYTEIWSLSYQCQYIWIYIQNMESTFHLYYPNLTADIHRHQLQLRLLHRVNQRFRDSRSISCNSFFKTKYGRNSSPTSLDPKVTSTF